MHPYLFVLAAMIVCACNSTPTAGSTDSAKVAAAAGSVTPAAVEAAEPDYTEDIVQDTNTVVKFPECTVTVNGFASDAVELAKENLSKDTILISPAEIGQMVSNSKITVETEVLAGVSIDFCFRNVAYVYNEGPICLMTDWKSIVSGWEQIPFRDGAFQLRELTENDGNSFPETALEDWKSAVRQHCGDSYFEVIQDNEKFNAEENVVTDEVMIRIRATRKADGQPFVRILKFSIPIGC